jgi:hypothetical protein
MVKSRYRFTKDEEQWIREKASKLGLKKRGDIKCQEHTKAVGYH